MKESEINIEKDTDQELGSDQEIDINSQEVLDSEKKRRFENIPVFEDRISVELNDIKEKANIYFSSIKKIFDKRDKLKDTDFEVFDKDFEDMGLEDLIDRYYSNIKTIKTLEEEYDICVQNFRSLLKENIEDESALSNFLKISKVHDLYIEKYKQLSSILSINEAIKLRIHKLISEELDLDTETDLFDGGTFKIKSLKKDIKDTKGFLGIGRFSKKTELQDLNNQLKRVEYLRNIYNYTAYTIGDFRPYAIHDFQYEDLLKKASVIIRKRFEKVKDRLSESYEDFAPLFDTENLQSFTEKNITKFVFSEIDLISKEKHITDECIDEFKPIISDLCYGLSDYIDIRNKSYTVTLEGLNDDDRDKYNHFESQLNNLTFDFRQIFHNIIKKYSNNHSISNDAFDTIYKIDGIYKNFNNTLIRDSVIKINHDCFDMFNLNLNFIDSGWYDIGIKTDRGDIDYENNQNIDFIKNLNIGGYGNHIFMGNFFSNTELSMLKERFGEDFDIKLKKMMSRIIDNTYLSNEVIRSGFNLKDYKGFIDSENVELFFVSYLLNNDNSITKEDLENTLINFKNDDSYKDFMNNNLVMCEIIDMFENGNSEYAIQLTSELIDNLLLKDKNKYTILATRFWEKQYKDTGDYNSFLSKIIQNKNLFLYKDVDKKTVSSIINIFIDAIHKGYSDNSFFELLDDWHFKDRIDRYNVNENIYKIFINILIKDDNTVDKEIKKGLGRIFGIRDDDMDNYNLLLIKQVMEYGFYDILFENIDKFINKDFSYDALLLVIFSALNNHKDSIKNIIHNHIDKFKNLGLESYKLIADLDIDLCINNLHVFDKVPEDIEIFKKVFQHSFNSLIYSHLKPIFEPGDLPEDLKKIGITEKGEKGVIQAKEILKESVFNLFSDDSAQWEKFIHSDLMMNYLSNYVKYSDSQFGQHDLNSFRKVLKDYQEQKSADEICPVPEYIKSKTLAFKRVKTDSIPWTESAYSRFDTIMDSYRSASELLKEGKPFTQIIKQIEDYRKDLISDLEEKLSTIEKPEAKIGVQKKIDNIKNLNFRSIEDFFTNIVSLNKDSDTHEFLRNILFLITLWKRPETRVDYFDDMTLDIDNATKLDEFISHIMNQEVFGSIYDKQDSKKTNKLPKKDQVMKAIKNIMNNHAINIELNQFMDKQNSDENIEVELIPSRGPIMEFSGHIASACWASKYKSIAAMFPNITSVIFKEKIDKESNRLSGAFLLIESVDENNNKVLIIRGLNPLDSLLNKIDIDDFYKKIKEYVSDIAKDDDRIPLVVSDDHSGGSSTNRPRLYSIIHFIDAKSNKKVILGKPDMIPSRQNQYIYKYGEYRGGHNFNGYNIDDVCYKI